MLMTAVVCSFILGIIFTLIIQFLIIRHQLSNTPVDPPKHIPQFSDFRLPDDLITALKDVTKRDKKESCLCLNLIIHFLFKQLKDTKWIRRWVIKKMNNEFAELMQKTTGRIIEQITVSEFNLGPTFPVIKSVAVKDTKLENNVIDELAVEVDLDYSGGFQLAVGIDLVLGKHVFLSVTITNLQGRARLQFSQKPYTHWSFSFYEEPQIDFSVESKYGGRATPQLTSLIITQIKRSIRKKHTLPNYKFRMKPFFPPPPPRIPVKDILVKGVRIGHGKLEVTIKCCSHLIDVPTDSFLYCTLSVDSCPWLELCEKKKKVWILQDVEIIKGQSESIGLNFKDEFQLEKYEDVVVVDQVTQGSPADQSDIRKGDVLVSIGTTKVTSTKQAAKLFKSAGERFIVRIERSKLKNNMPPELQVIEDSVSIKDITQNDTQKTDRQMTETSEDFVNISVKCDTEIKGMNVLPSPNSSPQKRMLDLVNSGLGKTFLRGRQKSNTIQEAPSVLRSTSPGRRSSPKPIRRNFSDKNLPDSGFSPSGSPQREIIDSFKSRSISDTSSLRSVDLEISVTSDMESSDCEEESMDVIQTVEVQACNNPVWNEKFNFNVGEDEKFLNLCVSCKIPEKVDKQNKVLKAAQVFPIGQVSLSLLDVCLDCLMTLQGDTQQTIMLNPAEAPAGASRSKTFAGHPGFDPKLCFGDVTLTFKHTPSKLSEQDRKTLTRKLPTPAPVDTKQESVIPKDIVLTDELKKIEKGKHDFTRTNFNTATYCNFCGKKIWLKAAFQCPMCKMICHKKCMERCQSETICTDDGPMDQNDPNVPWKPLVTKIDPEKRKQDGGGILSKFRNTDKKKTSLPVPTISKPQTPIPSIPNKLSPNTSPALPRRRNSAPGTEVQIKEAFSVPQSSQVTMGTMSQTQSSNSLQALSSSSLLKLHSDDLSIKSKSSEYDSSDDSDLEMDEVLNNIQKKSKGQNLDEVVVMAAKKMGKELFAELSLAERKEKLDLMVSKLQKEIDEESENKNELIKAEEETIDSGHKEALRRQIAKSDEKVEAMMMMMLHYCAGLQYCLDQEEEERQKKKVTKQTETEEHVTEKKLETGKMTQKVTVYEDLQATVSGNRIICPEISIEVASSPEEPNEKPEESSVVSTDTDKQDDDKTQFETVKTESLNGNQVHKGIETIDGATYSPGFISQDEIEDDLLAEVIHTVTEIIEKSEGESDSSSDVDKTLVESTENFPL